MQQENWTARFFVAGQRFRLATPHTKASDALSWAEKIRAEKVLELGVVPPTGDAPTLGHAVDAWAASKELRELARWTEDLKMVRGFVEWVGPRRSPRVVTSAMVHQWLEVRRHDVGTATKRRNVSKISVFFRWLISRGLAGGEMINPTTNVRLRGEGSARREGLGAAEIRRVLELVDGHPQLEAAYSLAFFAAMERSAIVAARWEDVDLEAGGIYVRGTKTKHQARDPRVATVPILPDLRAWIERRPRPEAGPIVAKSIIRRGEVEHFVPTSLERIRRRWNLDHPDHAPLPGFHLGRHTIATLLAASGVPIYVVSRFLRHSSVTTTERSYAHVAPMDRKESVQGWTLPDGGLQGKSGF